MIKLWVEYGKYLVPGNQIFEIWRFLPVFGCFRSELLTILEGVFRADFSLARSGMQAGRRPIICGLMVRHTLAFVFVLRFVPVRHTPPPWGTPLQEGMARQRYIDNQYDALAIPSWRGVAEGWGVSHGALRKDEENRYNRITATLCETTTSTQSIPHILRNFPRGCTSTKSTRCGKRSSRK